MENNVTQVRDSPELHDGTRELVKRAFDIAKVLLDSEIESLKVERGGRKAFHR
jgi:septation ring formation regulator EzrA